MQPGASLGDATLSRRALYLAVVLAATYFVAFLDRQSLNLFAIPIEHDLRLNDREMGLLLGLAFGALYGVLGVPFGLFADRANRRRLVIAGVACWSVSTLISALATSYAQLFLGRVGVGIGEATLAPAAASMINDAIPLAYRGRAFGVFSLGTTFGSGAASLLGAGVITLMMGHEFHWPLLGTLHAWQATLLIVALAGLPVIAALLGVQEPARGARAQSQGMHPIARHVGRHWRLYTLIYLANVLASLLPYSFYPWVPTALERSWHLSRAAIGLRLGLMIIVLSGVGVFGSGWVVDRFTRRGVQHAMAIVGTLVFGVLACIGAVIFRMPTAGLTWILIGLYILLAHIYFPFSLLALATVTPRWGMAAVSAVNFMLTGILGLSLGPSLVVLVSEHFFRGPAGVGHAISAVAPCLALVGGAVYALLWRALRDFVPENWSAAS
jgi:MFS family permease